MFVLPEELSKIILARLTSPAGRDRELAMPSSCSRCSGRRTKAAFGRPIAIDTPILHWRCLYSQQYYCHLFMGHNTSAFFTVTGHAGQVIPGTFKITVRGDAHAGAA